MKRTRFYKANGNVGSSLLFWAINNCGYTSDLDKAEIYTLEQAQQDVDNGWLRSDSEFHLSADHVEELAQWRVDHQYINKTYPEFTDPNDEYVSVKRNCWDGNDLAFGTGTGWDFDYSNAASISSEDFEPYIESLNQKYYFVPRYHADEIARRTFQMENINRRKMITKAGVVGLRKKKKRQTTGKNRFNCIVCGKLVWEFGHPDMQFTCGDSKCQIEHEQMLFC